MMKNSVFEVVTPKLDRYHLNLYEALFYSGNGYIGIRYDFEEGPPEVYNLVPSQYINGFYDFMPVKHAENLFGLPREKEIMANVANTQGIKLFLEDEEFSMFRGQVLQSRLAVNMNEGTMVREVLWRSEKGRTVKLKITRMTSFYQLPLFTIDYEVEPIDFSGEITFESTQIGRVTNYYNPEDPRTSDEYLQLMIPDYFKIKKDTSYMKSHTSRSNLFICNCVGSTLSQDYDQEIFIENHTVTMQAKTTGMQGKKIRFIKYSVFCDSLRYANYREQAGKEMEKARSVPLEYLYQKQKEYLTEYWDNCRVDIEGDDELDLSIKYNLYQLIQSVGKDRFCNIAPKGLSGDGYEGHYFWDTEMYIQPFFSITNPVLSKNLIAYRYATLDKARENAAIIGHKKGALYPWRTITGRECSGYFPAGAAQYHINGAVAHSIINYYLATKDIEFILEKGAEIIFETARLWIDAGNFNNGKFHINTVTGPDEYTCIVNNNYYTNAIAKYHLSWAGKFYDLLQREEGFAQLKEKIGLREQEIQEFQQASDSMYLPYDKTLQINPQDDSFLQKEKWDINEIPRENFPLLLHYHPLHIYRHQICKQADTILAHFIVEDFQSEEVMHNSFLYYEKITTHDSSLSKAIFSIMAARLGMEEKATAYFGDSAKLDLLDLQHNTVDGVHIANMGGSFMTVVYGFAGFRLKEQGISFAPMLPKKWKSYRFEICYVNSRIQVYVNDQQCVFLLEKGPAQIIQVYGIEYELKDILTVERHNGLNS
jgi:alpha,alpha-trehalose phosphorylase